MTEGRILSKREITCRMVGVTRSRMVQTFLEARDVVAQTHPGSHVKGSAGGWHWTDDSGRVVAATCPVMTPPLGRHWLAIKPPPKETST